MEGDWNFIIDDIRTLEKVMPETIQKWKEKIEAGNVQNNIIALLEETLRDIEIETQWQKTYILNVKFFWIILRYCLHNDYKGLRSWYDYQMVKGNIGVNAAFSKESILKYLFEKGKINSETIKAFEFENIINGNITSKKITEKILSEIDHDIKNPSYIVGFKCDLPRPIIDKVYSYMCENGFLEADPSDFEAAFNETPTRVRNPIKWLIQNERGIQPGRGNQTALYQFLKMVLKKVSNQDLKKCSDIFIDRKGKFIHSILLRPDKNKIKEFGFETKLNEILKKADQV